MVRDLTPRLGRLLVFDWDDRIYDPTAPAWTDALAILRDAEDQAQRAYSWGANNRHDHVVFSLLEQKHNEAIDKLQADSALWTRIANQLAEAMRNAPQTVLVHSCDHFASNYPLNRFLTLLVRRFAEPCGILVVRQRERVVGVAPDGYYHPNCQGSPTGCHGWPHEIMTQDWDCGGSFGAQHADDGPYHAVIVRHGAIPSKKILPAISRPRQILPYHAPAYGASQKLCHPDAGRISTDRQHGPQSRDGLPPEPPSTEGGVSLTLRMTLFSRCAVERLTADA